MVARFQSVISEEIRKQLLEKEGREEPDYVIACVGGGSNAAGAFYHFLHSPEVGLIAAEAAGKGLGSGESAATIHLGKEGIIRESALYMHFWQKKNALKYWLLRTKKR